jgi:hypothetical protein
MRTRPPLPPKRGWGGRGNAHCATATAVAAAAELRKRGRVRKLAPSDGWQTASTAVARQVVEDEQEDG